MPPNRHAVLSASSSHRWLHCNPSARLELEFEDRETEAAAEGTAAHALAEHKLRKALKMRSTRPVSKYDSDEMEIYTDGYLEFVLEAIVEARQDCPDPKVLIGLPPLPTASFSTRCRTAQSLTQISTFHTTMIGTTPPLGRFPAASPRWCSTALPSKLTR